MSGRKIERRRSKRVPFEVIIDYSSLDGFFSDYAHNISLGGIFLRTDTPFPPGVKVNLSFSLPGYDGLIETSGQVVWVVTPEEAKEMEIPSGMGIRFEDLSDRSKEIIDKLALLGSHPEEK